MWSRCSKERSRYTPRRKANGYFQSETKAQIIYGAIAAINTIKPSTGKIQQTSARVHRTRLDRRRTQRFARDQTMTRILEQMSSTIKTMVTSISMDTPRPVIRNTYPTYTNKKPLKPIAAAKPTNPTTNATRFGDARPTRTKSSWPHSGHLLPFRL